MTKDNSKIKCGSFSSHPSTKEKEKDRYEKTQAIFTNLQSARKESRANDIAMFEEQMHQLLNEWKAEFPSPATSSVDGSLGSFPAGLSQFLQEFEVEKDDATSPLTKPDQLKTELDPHNVGDINYKFFDDDQFPHHTFESFDQFDGSASTLHNDAFNYSDMINQFDCHQLVIDEGYDCNQLFENDEANQGGENNMPNVLPNIRPPPLAFLGPKCSLWDCFRPAQGLKCCQDYCSSSHELLANNEGLPGMTPIVRPGGVGVKDGPLFAALLAMTQGKEVGIPKCEGAASTKSPWNAPELFDLSFNAGESLREWLFFDKPRRAFVSGNRKQRSLPDYNGRGWHESRKQAMKEHGGLKRSYYMDPQPQSNLEWHLYEYEVDNHDSVALYRLEYKLVDKKKSPNKAKLTKESLADLQNKMGKLTADVPPDDGSNGQV